MQEALALRWMTLEEPVGPKNVLVSCKEEARPHLPSVLLSIVLGNPCCPSGQEHPPRLLSSVEGWCSSVRVEESWRVGFITSLVWWSRTVFMEAFVSISSWKEALGGRKKKKKKTFLSQVHASGKLSKHHAWSQAEGNGAFCIQQCEWDYWESWVSLRLMYNDVLLEKENY